MLRSLDRRLAKLEQTRAPEGAIVVWCHDEADVEPTIAAMIEAGEITEADRPRCVPWWDAPASASEHEARLESLEL